MGAPLKRRFLLQTIIFTGYISFRARDGSKWVISSPPTRPDFFWQQESATYQSMCQGGHRTVDASEDLVTFLEINSWWFEDEFPFGARPIFRGFCAVILPQKRDDSKR